MNEEIKEALWQTIKLMIANADAKEVAAIKEVVSLDHAQFKENLAACEQMLGAIKEREAELASKPKKKKLKKSEHSLLRT